MERLFDGDGIDLRHRWLLRKGLTDLHASNRVLLQRGDPTGALKVAASETARRFSRKSITGIADSDTARAWRWRFQRSLRPGAARAG